MKNEQQAEAKLIRRDADSAGLTDAPNGQAPESAGNAESAENAEMQKDGRTRKDSAESVNDGLKHNNGAKSGQQYFIEDERGQTVKLDVFELLELAKKGLKYDGIARQVEEQKKQNAEKQKQLDEFHTLFPYEDPELMARGYSLAVAYALQTAENARAKDVDDGNSKRSTGSAGAAPEREQSFSDQQIACMSLNEIKEKWPLIMSAVKRKVDF